MCGCQIQVHSPSPQLFYFNTKFSQQQQQQPTWWWKVGREAAGQKAGVVRFQWKCLHNSRLEKTDLFITFHEWERLFQSATVINDTWWSDFTLAPVTERYIRSMLLHRSFYSFHFAPSSHIHSSTSSAQIGFMKPKKKKKKDFVRGKKRLNLFSITEVNSIIHPPGPVSITAL